MKSYHDSIDSAAYLDIDYVRTLMPVRRNQSDKNDYGRVFIIAGCEGFTGAPYFAAQAAVLTGSGVVTLALPRAIYPILAHKLNEPVILPFPDDDSGKFSLDALDAFKKHASRASAVLIGCGLGRSAALDEIVAEIVRTATCPLVIDADGINALAGHIDVLRDTTAPVILTPHQYDFSRLSGIRPEQIDAASADTFATETGCTLVTKGYHTLITAPDGRQLRNTSGNPGMAKAGSGDVLAGIILSLVGQGIAPFDAACAGVWLHGAAGDLCAKDIGQYGMIPTDMLHTLPAALRLVTVSAPPQNP